MGCILELFGMLILAVFAVTAALILSPLLLFAGIIYLFAKILG